ncbi:MAG: hypothetical protein KGH57_00560 [Candidatus Micrarchaeota archaeon]|nr:hypothetical protein [Candidatus Micrarchaeota archaeon]
MKYFVAVNRKYQYVKVYNVIKKINENTNALSKATSRFIDKFLLKKKGTGLE